MTYSAISNVQWLKLAYPSALPVLPFLVEIRKKILLPNRLEPAAFSLRRNPAISINRKYERSPLTRAVRTENKEPMELLDTPAPKDMGGGDCLNDHHRAQNPVTEDSAETAPPLKGIALGEFTAEDEWARLTDASVRGATPAPLAKNGKPERLTRYQREALEIAGMTPKLDIEANLMKKKERIDDDDPPPGQQKTNPRKPKNPKSDGEGKPKRVRKPRGGGRRQREYNEPPPPKEAYARTNRTTETQPNGGRITPESPRCHSASPISTH